jgi:general stress protein YciG
MAAEQSNHFTREHEKQEREHSTEQTNQHAGATEHRSNNDSKEETPSRKDKRGFASMDAALQKQIASKGGRAAHAQGVAHEFNSTEAREAGRKGGVAVSRNRQHMAEIGKKGGEAAHNKRKKENNTL